MNFGDAEISFFYFLSPFVICTCNFIATYTYQRFGIKKSFYFMTSISTMNLCLVFMSVFYKPAFLLTVFFSRFFSNYSIIMNDLISFSLFKPQTGIMYVKLFTLGYFISAIIAILINSFFLRPDNVYPIFFVFALFNISNYFIESWVFSKYKFE